MKLDNRVSVVTIGTEVTSGEILNRNASWLARQLSESGFEVKSHISVPDDPKQIIESMERALQDASQIFLTGGLGPTSDDITRDQVARLIGVELEYHEEGFKELERRYVKMGRRLLEGHKRLFMFPKSSSILKNRVGTAHGFCLEYQGAKIWSLPGPPRELEAIWTDHIQPELEKMSDRGDQVLYRWKCLGAGESEIAAITEKIFADSGFTLGYRASVPYVIVKVWVPKRQLSETSKWFDRFEKELEEFIVFNDDLDPLAILLEAIHTSQRFCIFSDRATQGELAQRLSALASESPHLFATVDLSWRPCHSFARMEESQPPEMIVASGDHDTLFIRADSDTSWVVGGRVRGESFETQLHTPYQLKLGASLARKFLVESTLLYWVKFFQSLPVEK